MRLKSNPEAATGREVEDFQAFVVARGTHLYRTACLLTGGDVHMAEDLVQETLGRMYAAWGKRRRIDNPAGYAQTVLVHTFITLRRKKSSQEQLVAEVWHPADGSGHGSASGAGSAGHGVVADADLRMTLVTALRQLSPQDRAVLVLRYWEDRSVEETAAALRTSAGAVRTRSGRALARLRDQLGAEFPEFSDH